MADRILVVEDEDVLRVNLGRYLLTRGYQVDSAAQASAAMSLLEENAYDVVLTDMRLPDLDGVELAKHIHSVAPSTVILVMTAYGTLESAVQAFRNGVYDYVLKPFSLHEIGQKIESIARYHQLVRENCVLRQEIQKQRDPDAFIVGNSRVITEVIKLVMKVASSSSTVLVTGESGTGKELVARALHKYSGREGLFVPLNMAAIQPDLVESQLFGHVRGAFTGADRAREGAFRTAAGGTLFLDEIGELPLSVQPKLLRALEAKEIIPVGSDVPVKVDVRVVAATHRDLKRMVQTGDFRQDLLFRLNVMNIHIPPLRERPEDIPLLVEHFLERYRRNLTKSVLAIDNQALACLTTYPWKGNARELSNVIERAVLLCNSPLLQVADLPADVRGGSTAGGQKTLKEAVEQFEYRHIVSVLEGVGGNRELAAKALGLSPATLYRYLDRLGLTGYRSTTQSDVAATRTD